jgi:hypothetical protein
MTPAERAVIEVAIAWRQARKNQRMPMDTELLDALDGLDSERAAPAATEKDITWAEVVTEDEIFSAKTGRWYEVITTARQGDRVKIQAKGLPKIITPPASGSVKVRRGESGQAVDLFTEVLMSGPNGVKS